jgi:hypothetical protein
MFENTKIFGPMIKIMIVMTQQLLKFVFIWALVILLFGCIGIILLLPYEAFQSTSSAFYYLICGALGNWDPATFDIENMKPVY